MKHIIILGDGMADHAVERLGGKTLLQYADTPYMDMLARKGRPGRLVTVDTTLTRCMRAADLWRQQALDMTCNQTTWP